MRKGGFTSSRKLALFMYIKRDMMYGRPHFLWIDLNFGTCSHFHGYIYFIKKVEHRWESNIWATGCTKGYCENKLACQKIDYFQASTKSSLKHNTLHLFLTFYPAVNIKRPPTAAQQGVYTASSRGPPVQAVKGIKPRPHSAKARITSDTSAATVPKTRPPWRPFSGHAALNRRTPFPATATKGAKDSSAAEQEEEFHSDLRPLPTVYQDRYVHTCIVSVDPKFKCIQLTVSSNL